MQQQKILYKRDGLAHGMVKCYWMAVAIAIIRLHQRPFGPEHLPKGLR